MKSSLPKLATSLAALVGVARKENDTARIEAALAEAHVQVETAAHERDAVASAYRDGLLDVSPEALEKLLVDKASATVRLDRAEALVEALSDRLASAREAEGRAARRQVHLDAVAKADAIAGRFPTEYSFHCNALRGLLAAVAEAEVAREKAAPFGEEFGYLPPVEDAIRRGLGEPEEIVASEVVTLWCLDGRVEPIPAERQGDVRSRANAGPDRGYLPAEGTTAGVWECSARRYRRISYRPAVPSSTADSLLRAVHLPAVHNLGENYVTAEPWRSADTALAHLSATRAADPVIARTICERLELIPEEPAAREAIVPFPKGEPEPAPRTPSARETRAALARA